ncbi:MAG TPA: sulfotransferase domain-containing protein [Isosphaeraceae bacterium]|nr:sulfotransferase domain-containing protein [Isosphaeraceae bacterium]
MDVLCVGMYRACSTWQYDVAAEIVERHRGGQRLGYLTGEEYAALVRREPRSDTWRILKSHEEHPEFTRALRRGEAVALYAHRDVRDVVYSMLHKRRVDFETFLKQGMIHQILENDRYWTSRPHLLVQTYQPLMTDPVSGVLEIARFLDITLKPSEAESIAGHYSLEANRDRARRMAQELETRGLDLNDRSNAQLWDQATLLHWNHIRSGRVGEWQEHADDRQRRILLRLLNRWLTHHAYEPDRRPNGYRLRVSDERAMLRGWIACQLRCLALRHPRLAHGIKTLLGLTKGGSGAPGKPVQTGSGHPHRQEPHVAVGAGANHVTEPPRQTG